MVLPDFYLFYRKLSEGKFDSVNKILRNGSEYEVLIELLLL